MNYKDTGLEKIDEKEEVSKANKNGTPRKTEIIKVEALDTPLKEVGSLKALENCHSLSKFCNSQRK